MSEIDPIYKYMGTVITGKNFKELFKGKKVVKLTNKKCEHRGIIYDNGPVTDTIKWNPTGECLAGGIYFCLEDSVHRWIAYNTEVIGVMEFMWDVDFDDDTLIYVEHDKFKAHTIKLSNKQHIWSNPQKCIDLVSKDASLLEYVPEKVQIQHQQMCIDVISRAPYFLNFVCEQVQIQNSQMCIDVVLKNLCLLRCVCDKIQIENPQMCIDAVSAHPWIIRNVCNQVKIKHPEILNNSKNK